MRISWRLASRCSVITLALLVIVIVALWSARTSGGVSAIAPTNTPGLLGTDLGAQPAPDFHLTDQFGHPISLAQFRGEPVVLTFLYTHCPDVCPLVANKLHATQVQLGAAASHVVMLAVSMDPIGDTPASAQAFSQTHKLTNNWHYLLGTQAQLSPVWNAYSIYDQPSTTTVTHTSAIYLIDSTGHERVFFSDDVTPTQLTNDLKDLLKEA